MPLDVCPSELCHQWREQIRQMLVEGKSPAEIEQYFVDTFGARVLATPPHTGLNWLVYVGPPAALLAGVYILFRTLRIWKRKGQETTRESETGTGSGTEPATDEYINRLEAELKIRK